MGQEAAPLIPIDQFEIFAGGLDHPECCAFDREGKLWAGGEAGQIYRIDIDGRSTEIGSVGKFCGGVAFSPEDRLFACVPGIGVVQVERGGRWHVFAADAGGRLLVCPNFPVFDRAGNLYVSDSGDWNGNNGRLIRFDKGGRTVVLADGLGYANGLALAKDEQSLFMAESDTNSVLRIALHDGGTAGTVETYLAPVGHVPDGLSLDADGNLYITCYGSHEIYMITPERELALLARDYNGMLLGGPTNLCFGGQDFDEIYVANLCRFTISRARIGRKGLRPVNLRS